MTVEPSAVTLLLLERPIGLLKAALAIPRKQPTTGTAIRVSEIVSLQKIDIEVDVTELAGGVLAYFLQVREALGGDAAAGADDLPAGL